MTDQEFLWWIHQRLVNVHKESELLDYMHHLRAIIVDMAPTSETARVARMDTEPELLAERFGK